MRSSNVPEPRRRRSADGAEPVAPPAAEASDWDETYDEASHVAEDYPPVRLGERAIADKLMTDTRWQQICESISTHGALDRHYLD